MITKCPVFADMLRQRITLESNIIIQNMPQVIGACMLAAKSEDCDLEDLRRLLTESYSLLGKG